MLTGSYDELIRVYAIDPPSPDTCGARTARLLAKQNLGGGVWRLRLLGPVRDDGTCRWRFRILASCMHAGARIVEVKEDADGNCLVAVVARFEEHKSMNYGSDFRPGLPESKNVVCVSTSFYDRLLCLWEVDWHQDAAGASS